MTWGTKRVFYDGATEAWIVPYIHLDRIEGVYMVGYHGDGMKAAELAQMAREEYVGKSADKWEREDFLKGIEHMRQLAEPYQPPEERPRRYGCFWAACAVIGFWVAVLFVLFIILTWPTNRVPQSLSSEPYGTSNPG